MHPLVRPTSFVLLGRSHEVSMGHISIPAWFNLAVHELDTIMSTASLSWARKWVCEPEWRPKSVKLGLAPGVNHACSPRCRKRLLRSTQP